MEKLTEVSRIAESLDHVLKNIKASMEIVDSDETSVSEKKTRSNNNSDVSIIYLLMCQRTYCTFIDQLS
jgi:hypothetical protein